MEILNSFTYTPMTIGAIVYICMLVCAFAAIFAYCISENGMITTIITVAIVVVCATILITYRNNTIETHYQGYITNWEEYCEQYDTVSVEGELVTAKLKEKK